MKVNDLFVETKQVIAKSTRQRLRT
ncbi:Protein of unknown function [Bacillus wiedmannii]|uniref:Uncharacterized protein n=1 Tax=Bacillus wiedmannii TaxID=1890302 RepID=A0AB37Z1J3_9BACI|nr:Protein of unknown function [Bacillus wiedmannii]